MILLLELHRYGQSQTEDIKQELTFYPCGKLNANNEPEDPTLLLRMIGYSHCIGATGFRDTVGRFLQGANLNGANLDSAYLRDANLDGAYLDSAYLRDANLDGAYLRDTNLRGAYLRDANLDDANLRGANLRGAYLGGANLEGANLGGANLGGANLSIDEWGDVRWNEATNWSEVRGLETAINVPEALRQQLGF